MLASTIRPSIQMPVSIMKEHEATNTICGNSHSKQTNKHRRIDGIIIGIDLVYIS